MANRYRRSTMSRARQRALMRRRTIVGGGILAALVVVALIVLILPKGGPDRAVEAVAPAAPAITEEPVSAPAEATPTPEPTPTPELTPEPTPESTPVSDEMAARALTRPTPTAEGFMPVFSRANTEEKICAITVDDCFQANNLQQIVDCAISVGGKLTIFPIGKNALKEPQAQILKYAWENGFELENHTLSHSGLFDMSNEEMADEVFKQQMVLSYILGVDYQPHFLRPRGGDARNDQRMQMYAKQLGYYGIAHWSQSGSADDKSIAKGLKPGAIFLFHTTNTDLDKLLRFIPWVVEKGYKLVTLNEMFGYPENETRPLAKPANEYETPALEPYQMVYVPLKKTTFCWEAYLVQQALLNQGYSLGEDITAPTGMYGPDTEKAVKAYQRDHGLEETGVADVELVKTLIEGLNL